MVWALPHCQEEVVAAASAVVESPQMEHVICSKGILLVKNRFTVYTPNPLGLPYYIIGIYGVIWGYMGLS